MVAAVPFKRQCGGVFPDGSIFVTSGAVNPTRTIQALALYIADAMKQRLATLFD